MIRKKLTFHPLTPPSQVELDNLLKSIAQRTLKLLKKRGLIVKDEGAEYQFLNIKDTEAIEPLILSSALPPSLVAWLLLSPDPEFI